MLEAAYPTTPLESLLKPGITAGSVGGKPTFLGAQKPREVPAMAGGSGNGFKNFFKRWPRLYECLVWIVGPSFFTGLTARRFVRKYPVDGTILHAGSGTRRLPVAAVNVDLFPFEEVDLVADLGALPFRDGAFAAVTCDQVLEHVPSPHIVALELMRVVRPGGLIHIASPFLLPWHPSPLDYNRWTVEGLTALFPSCALVESGITAGPCSALTAFLAAFLAVVLSFGSRHLREALQYVFLLLLCPIKFLDLVVARLPGASLCAANVYVVVRLPG